MRHVMQRRNDDCFSACLASLLDVPLEDVPNFYRRSRDGEHFHCLVQKWLARHFGLTVVTLVIPGEKLDAENFFCKAVVPARFIVGVPVGDGDHHAVIASVYRHRLRLVHDPAGPGRRVSLRKANDISFLVPLLTTHPKTRKRVRS